MPFRLGPLTHFRTSGHTFCVSTASAAEKWDKTSYVLHNLVVRLRMNLLWERLRAPAQPQQSHRSNPGPAVSLGNPVEFACDSPTPASAPSPPEILSPDFREFMPFCITARMSINIYSLDASRSSQKVVCLAEPPTSVMTIKVAAIQAAPGKIIL